MVQMNGKTSLIYKSARVNCEWRAGDMPIIPCPACKQNVSDQAVACPGCGHPVAKTIEDRQTQRVTLGCLGIVVVIIVIAVISDQCGSSKKSASSPSGQVDISASIDFTGTEFTIDNSDNFDWKDVEVEINSGIIFGGFKLNVPVIRAHKKYSVGALEFVKSDGTRFNPILTKLLHISISCETPSGYGWWDDTF
jgi:hypothetical protein